MIEYGISGDPVSMIRLIDGERKNLNHFSRNSDGHIDSTNVYLSANETGGKYCIDYDDKKSGHLENGEILLVKDLVVRGGTKEQLETGIPSIRVINPNG